MADIRNDQYLHRPGAGRGAITPADPLEVLLYDGSGNPLLVKTPTGETRQALGVAGYGYDGTNWRPVKVNASGQAEVQLTGSIAQSLLQYHADLDEVFMPRAVRQAGNENIWLSPPDGAIGVFIYAKAYSVTGQFGSNQGFYLRLRRQSFNSVLSSDALLDYATEPHQSVESGVSIAVFPGANEVLEGKHIKANHPLVGGLWRLGIYVSGAFGEGEGIDCEVRGHWVFK